MNVRLRTLDTALEGVLLGVLLFSPLPLGSIVPWAQAVIEGGVAVLVMLSVVRMLADGELVLPRTPLLWPVLAMSGVLALQLLVPDASVSPYATSESARLFAAYVGLLLVLTWYLATRARILRLLCVLVAWGAGLAVLGLVNLAGRGSIPWLPKGMDVSRLTSTYVNPNHQALYFSIVFFLGIGLLLRPRRRAAEGGAPASAPAPERLERAWARLLVGAGVALAGLALVLTLSRGAFVGTLLGLLVVLGLGFLDRATTRLAVALGAGLVVLVAYLGWIGLDGVIGRFVALSREPFGDLRWPVWEATIRMVGEAPFLGVGLGAFADAFARYRPASVPLDKVVDYAHSDYLQLLAEAGTVGLLVALWALFGLVRFVARWWVLRRDPFVRGMTMGLFGALTAVVVHSAVDFGLHVPGNAVLAVVVAALLPAVVTVQGPGRTPAVGLPAWRWRPSTPQRRFVGVVTAAACVAALALVTRPAMADWYVARAAETAGGPSRAAGAVTREALVRAVRDLRRASALDPRNPVVNGTLGDLGAEVGLGVWLYGVGPDGRRLIGTSAAERLVAAQDLLATALEAYERAVRYRPRDAAAHERVAWFLAGLEDLRRSVKATPLDAVMDPRLAATIGSADSLIPRGLNHLQWATQWDPNNALRHRSVALYVLSYVEEEPRRSQLAAAAFRHALDLQPKLLGRIIDDLVTRRADEGLLREAVPRRFELVLGLARHLAAQGRFRGASAAFEEAVRLAVDPAQQLEGRLAYARGLLQAKEPAAALVQARQALVLDPKNAEVFAVLGEVYDGLRQYAEAEAAYGSAITLSEGQEPRRRNEHRARFASHLTRRGEGERALAAWRQVLQHTPNDPWAHLELARLLQQRQEGSEAFLEYRAAHRLGAKDPDLQRAVAEEFSRSGYLREAAVALELAVSLRPGDLPVRLELAALYARMDRREQAMEQYRQVLARQPDNEAARRGAARLTVPAGKPTS